MSTRDNAEFSYPGVQPPNKITLSPEELAVLKECNKEGFSKRGIPCGLVFAVGCFYAAKNGIIKTHPRFGVLPAVAVSGVVGCVTGSLSYKFVCAQRVLALPNGTLRQQMEALQRGGAAREPTRLADLQPEQYELDPKRPMVSGSQMDIYQSNNNFDGFTGVNNDGDQLSNYDTTKPLPIYSPGVTTYDDLRQRNRDEYMRSTASRQYNPPSRGAAPPASQDYPPVSRPSGPIFEDSRPFDRDRVPQYQLD